MYKTSMPKESRTSTIDDNVQYLIDNVEYDPEPLINYIVDLKNRIDKTIRILETLKQSARWERHLYEIDELLYILKK